MNCGKCGNVWVSRQPLDWQIVVIRVMHTSETHVEQLTHPHVCNYMGGYKGMCKVVRKLVLTMAELLLLEDLANGTIRRDRVFREREDFLANDVVSCGVCKRQRFFARRWYWRFAAVTEKLFVIHSAQESTLFRLTYGKYLGLRQISRTTMIIFFLFAAKWRLMKDFTATYLAGIFASV